VVDAAVQQPFTAEGAENAEKDDYGSAMLSGLRGERLLDS